MIDYIHSSLFLEDSTITNILIYDEETGTTFGNDKIYYEELDLNESISMLSDLTFGSCTSNYIKLKVRSDVGNLKGKTITISLILNENTDDPFVLGTYKVQKDNLQANEGSRIIEAYDLLYDLINTDVADWYNEMYEADEAYTIAQLRHSLLEKFGITEQDTTLINDNVLCEKTIKPFSLSGYDVFSNICEINGVFAHIGRDNVLKYISLDNAETYQVTLDKYVSMDYESYDTGLIDCVQIRAEENDIGGAYPQNIESTNGLVVEDNFLMYGKSTSELNTIAQNLYNKIHNISYVPIELLAKGNPCVEVGDAVRVQTTSGDYINSFVLERRLQGIQTMADSITAMGNEERDENINSIQSKFMQLKGQTATLSHTVDGLTSTVTTIEGNYVTQSELSQTSDSLTAQIESLQKEIDGETSIYYLDYVPTLENYPAQDFTYNIPVNNTVQLRDDLKFEYTEEYYRKNQRALVYNTSTGMAYRFSKYNGEWGWIEIADTETALILQKIAQLELSDENIIATVTQIEENFVDHTELQSSIEQSATQITSTVSATYETKSNANTTKQTLQSQITQNANQIALKVSEGQVSSSLSLETGQITIRGDRLAIDSTNFKLANDGSVTATGTFKTTNNNGWATAVEVNGYHLYRDNRYVGWFGYSARDVGTVKKSGSNAFGKDFYEVRVGNPEAQYIMYTCAYDRSIQNENHNFTGSAKFSGNVQVGSMTMDTPNGDAIIDPAYWGSLPCVNFGSDAHRTSVYIRGDLGCNGNKNRLVETESYGMRALNAFETATANFGDSGCDEIGKDGLCEILFDEIWTETVDLSKPYQVLITRTSEKETSWVEKKESGFIVHGTEGATFDWMVIARQKDYSDVRLEPVNIG